jgi:hypothetical protein
MLVAILSALLGSSICDSSWRVFQKTWSEVVDASPGEVAGPSRLRTELDRLQQRTHRRTPRCESIRSAAAALTEEYACLERSTRSCDRVGLDSLVGEVVRGGEPDLLRVVHPISANLVPTIDSLLLRKARRSEDLRQTLRRSALSYGVRPYLIETCASHPFAVDPRTWEHCANYVYEFRGLQGWKTYRETIRKAARDSPSRREIDRIEPLGKAWLRESIYGGVSLLAP